MDVQDKLIVERGYIPTTDPNGKLIVEYSREIPKPPATEKVTNEPVPVTRPIVNIGTDIRRNAPCPCGCGKKFKRCPNRADRLPRLVGFRSRSPFAG